MATKIEAQLITQTTMQCAVVSPVFTDTTFLRTDIGRAHSDLFSCSMKTFSRQSAALRLIVSSFFTNFFIMAGGRTIRQAVIRWIRPSGYCPPFFPVFHFHSIGNANYPKSRDTGPTIPPPAFPFSHCKRGMSVRPSFPVSKLHFTGGRQSQRAFARIIPDSGRVYVPERRSPFLRHLSLFFHNRSYPPNGCGTIEPFPSVLSSHCKRGIPASIRFFNVFSGGVRRSAANGIPVVRPSFCGTPVHFFIIC